MIAGSARITRRTAIVVVLGFVGVVQSLLVQPPEARDPLYDELRFELWTSNLVDRGFYGDTPDQFPAREEMRAVGYRAYVPPGYVFFLAALRKPFGSGPAPLRVAQALLVGIAIVVSSLTAARLFGDLAAIVTAGALIATGVLATYSSFALSELLAATTLICSVWLTLVGRDRRSVPVFAAAGTLLGASILVRPQVLLLPIAVAVWCVVANRHARAGAIAALAFAAACGAVVAPWTARNYAQLNAFVPVSTYTWINFWLVNHEGADGIFRRPERDIGEEAVREIRSHGEVAQDLLWRDLALDWVREHPGDAARGWIRNGRRFVGDRDSVITRWYRLRGARVPRVDDRWLFAVAFAGGLVAAARRRWNWDVVLLGGVALYFVAFFCFFVPTARFRVGVLPVVAVLAGGSIEYAVRLMRAPRIRRGHASPAAP